MLQQMVVVLLLLLLFPINSFAAVGKVEQNTGTAELLRSKDKLVVEKDLGIEMNDDVRTGNGVVRIGFDDKTKVKIEKHSKLVIDDFVYDSNSPSTSKLGLKVTLGTVKYASGLIAKNNKQAVAISTPTARIGVLGTSFSMTVDEVGKSLIILLPDANGTVGEIKVESDVGQVILNQAYQATVVGAAESAPTPPVILDLSEAQINNLLIVRKPKEKEETVSEESILDFNELDVNLLDENKLDKDELVFTRLDFSLLDLDLLANILDILNSKILLETESFPTNPIKVGQYENGSTQIIGGDTEDWEIYRQVDGRIFSIKVGNYSQTQIQLNQAGSNVTLYTQENASDSLIIINQN